MSDPRYRFPIKGHAVQRIGHGWGCACGAYTEKTRTAAQVRAAEHRRAISADPSARLLDAWNRRVVPKIEIVDSGCWEFTGYRLPPNSELAGTGYGQAKVSGRTVLVHRLSAAVHHRLDIDDHSIEVCHRCDNPPCCNPDHLFLGTRQDNVDDAVAKGRALSGQRRKTHCPQGHPYEGENLAVRSIPARGGRPAHISRQCRTCLRDGQRARRNAAPDGRAA